MKNAKQIVIVLTILVTLCLSGCRDKEDAALDDTKQHPFSSSVQTQQGTQTVISDTSNEPVSVTDTAEQYSKSTVENNSPTKLKFSELFAQGSSRGLFFSDKLQELNGQSVIMSGYMAPPLKPSLDFFVLTLQPMAICPFCDTDASWPSDIVLVYMQNGKAVEATTNALQVTGTLDIGSYTDEATGFVSQIRIYADKIEQLK